jgi:uncharacterized damage-inducible protein DinB
LTENRELIATIYEGWHTYQKEVTRIIGRLDSEQLAIRAGPGLRTVGEMAGHVIAARARRFYQLMGLGGEEFKAFSRWDRRGAKDRTAEELVKGLESTWKGMHEAIASWTADDWKKSWPREYDGEPKVIMRQWVIWHLIEHDLHHGGEISITLGAHGVPALEL